ncbi:BppU family phage baseplate upper protein [Bacillus sp. 1P10SD]|uniref:DUF2808 domain-containing protein n=1 Tax=Bacillus sp. 1P10SD TaxID=3132265 RepID=UPI0039A43490
MRYTFTMQTSLKRQSKGVDKMTAKNQNFSMYAGDSKNIVVPVTKDDGSNVDLTGATVKWVLKKYDHDTTNILLKESEIIIQGNEITLPIKPPDTSELAGTYYHECEIKDQNENVSTIFVGLVSIKRSGVLRFRSRSLFIWGREVHWNND